MLLRLWISGSEGKQLGSLLFWIRRVRHLWASFVRLAASYWLLTRWCRLNELREAFRHAGRAYPRGKVVITVEDIKHAA
jgi:hypothetical protein